MRNRVVVGGVVGVIVAACGNDGVHHLPAEIVLDEAPSTLTNQAHSRFVFHVVGVGDATAIACATDGAEAPCTSPFEIDLADGPHHFEVRIGDGQPTTHDWTIDTLAPHATITSGPPALDSVPSEQIAFVADDPSAVFECALDAAAFATCTSPVSLAPGDGDHAFAVRAKDPAGNVEGTPATHAWTLDSTPPAVVLDAHPADPSKLAAPTFAFSSNDASAALACAVDGGAFAACTSPLTLPPLLDGAHALAVQATDPAGNVGHASFTWMIDTVAPVVTFTSTPADPTTSTSATFAWTASEAATFECQLDGGAFASCTSPTTLSNLPDATHPFVVYATDAAGNIGSAGFSWSEQSQPPTVTIVGATACPTTGGPVTVTFTVSSGSAACSLNSAPFTPCSSPVTVATTGGVDQLVVQATNLSGTGSATTYVCFNLPP